jgi:mono/diheme cytochrome c family protein
VVFIGFGVVLPVALLTGNHANASGQVGGLKLTAGEKQGRELFGEHCSICHTLSAANAIGKVGPNLDQIQPSETLVLHTIANGCLANASTSSNPNEVCLGQGTMPADLIQGKQAQEVAAFVARVAGQE